LFCASSNILKFSQINDIINKTDWFYLPNVICILDKGLIININKELINNGKLSMNLYPEFIPSDEKNNYEWIFLEFDKSNNNLGSLYYSILEHLNSCVLKNPEMLIYMNKLFNISIENIEFLSQY